MEEEVKVSELPSATSANDEDLVMIVQDGYNKQITKENLFKDTNDKIEDLEIENTQQDFTVTSNFTIEAQSCFKLKGFINIGLNIYNANSTFSKTTWVEIATLPSGYRPTNTRYISAFGCNSAWTSPTAVPIMVETSGAVKIYVQTDLKRIFVSSLIKI